MPNTSITQWGLDYASSASPSGTLIAPLYWVPVYDSRIDGLIHDNTLPVSAFSACVNVSATEPTGEVIWNVDGVGSRYALSDTDKVFILSGSGTVSANSQTITGPIQSQQWQINQLNGTPLANHFSATEAYFNPANLTWNTSAAFSQVTGDNTPVESGNNKYFEVIDYYPVSADAGDSRLRGMVKCRLAKDIGTVKFNKVALYIASFNSSGQQMPGEPVLFAECQLKTTVIKTTMGTNGFDDVTVDVQLDLHSIEANWADVFFSTSGDYWSRVPDGVYYPERVGIGSFIDSVLSPQASLHVRRTRAMVNLGITDAPVARFDFDDTNYHQIDISDTGLVHQTFVSDYGNLGLYYQPLDKTIYPDTNGVSLGVDEVTKRFGSIYLDAGGINIADIASTDLNYLKAYFVDGVGYIEASDNVSMTFNTVSEDPAVLERAYIEGADIRKKGASIVNYTFVSETGDDYIIMAGIEESDSQWYSIEGSTSQYGVTHKNILYLMENSLATNVSWISKTKKVKIFGRGEIDLYGPVMLDAFVFNEDDTVPYQFGSLMSRQFTTLMATAVASETPDDIIIAAAEADLSDDPITAWANIVSSLTGSGQYQILGRIRHSEDLRPLISDTSIMGVPGLLDYTLTTPEQTAIAYKELYVTQIGSYYGKAYGDEGELAYADNRVSTIYAKDIGTTESASGWARIHRMAMVGLINSGFSNVKGAINAGFDLGYIWGDPTYGDTEYGSSTAVYPFTSESETHPRCYGLWPKNYLVLGNRTDMRNSVVNGKLLYSDPDSTVGKSTIDLICTRFMTLTNTLEFEGAFKILGKYRTSPWGYYPGQDATGVTVDTETAGYDAAGWPGIHKTGTWPVTLGDRDEYLDAAFITQLFAGSLTLTGALTVGAISFAKTTTWSPFYTATVPTPAITTDGPKSSIITDVIKIPINATCENYVHPSKDTTAFRGAERVFMHYQITNNVVTGHIDTISNYVYATNGRILYPIYNESTQSALQVNTIIPIQSKYPTIKWQKQTIVFGSEFFAPTESKIFNVGQYVIITTADATSYTEKQSMYPSGNMLYGIVTAFTPYSGPGTYSITVEVIYYTLWNSSTATVGECPLTGTYKIITAMPFLLRRSKKRAFGWEDTIEPISTFNIVRNVYEKHGSSIFPAYPMLFTNIGIDIAPNTPGDGAGLYNYFSAKDTIQPFTFPIINPNTEPVVDIYYP